MSNVRWTVDADVGKAVADIKKIVEAQQQFLKKLDEQTRLTNAQREANKQAREEEQRRQRVIRDNTAAFDKHVKAIEKSRTPIQRYNDTMRELQKIENLGIGTKEQHARARDLAKKKLEDEERALRENTEEHRRNVRVQEEAKRAYLSSRPAIEKYKAAISELKTVYRSTNMSQEEFLARKRELRAEFDKDTKGTPPWVGMAKSFAATAASALSIQAAISTARQAMQELIELERERADFTMDAATAEEQARLNMVALSKEEQDAAIKAAEAIAKKRGTDLPRTIAALGAAMTASGADIEKALPALDLGAQFGVLDPEAMGTFTEGFLDLMKAADLSAKEAAAMLLSTGGQLRVTDPRRFGRVLAGQAFNAVSSYADPVQAARQSMALTAGVGNVVGDRMGEATQTFVTSLQTRLTETFNDLPAAIAAAQAKVDKLTAEDMLTPKEKATIEENAAKIAEKQREVDRLQGAAPGSTRDRERIMAEAELSRMRASADEYAAGTSLSPLKREELRTQQAIIADLKNFQAQDTGDLFDRMRLAQGSSAFLAEMMKTDFGEQKFKEVRNQLLSGALLQSVEANILPEIKFTEADFNQMEAAIGSGRVGGARTAGAITNTTQAGMDDTMSAVLAAARESIVNTVEQTRPSNFARGTVDMLRESMVGFETASRDPLGFAIDATGVLRRRSAMVTDPNSQQGRALQSGIDANQLLITYLQQNLGEDAQATLERLADTLDRLEGALANGAANAAR